MDGPRQHRSEVQGLVEAAECYLICDCAGHRIGFQAKWGNQDMVWMSGLDKQIGYVSSEQPGAAFQGVIYNLDRSEVRAVRAVLDERDRILWPDARRKAWPDRNYVNPMHPDRFEQAMALMDKRQRQEEAGPSIWIPDNYEN